MKINCIVCNNEMNVKPSRISRLKNGKITCGLKCSSILRKETMSGENNHQFGLKGNLNASFKGELTIKRNHNNIDLHKYVGLDYPGNNKGRILYHRFLVQENYKLFDISFFDLTDGKYILKNDLDIHHKDNDHNNNSIGNLEVISRSEHTSLHNRQKAIIRGPKGRIKGIKINKNIQNEF